MTLNDISMLRYTTYFLYQENSQYEKKDVSLLRFSTIATYKGPPFGKFHSKYKDHIFSFDCFFVYNMWINSRDDPVNAMLTITICNYLCG